MKNLSLGLLALFFCVPCSHSEVIDSVLFNPSRLGRYEDLKVSSELSAPGGVLVKESSAVQSKSSVTVTSPAYELTNASAQQVSLPNTRFNTKTFTVGGGSAAFTSGQVQELKDAAGKMMRVKGNTVNVTGNVHVNMAGGTEVNGGEVKGLKLGGNDIPRPGEGCEELGWYAYKTTSGKEYKILGFKKCAGEEEEECTKTCGEGYTLNEEKCECEKDACKLTCGEGYKLNESTCECEKVSCPSPTSTPSGYQSCTVTYNSYHNGQQSIPGESKPEWDTQTCKWVYKTCTPKYNVWTLVDNPAADVLCHNKRYTSEATINSGSLIEAKECAAYSDKNVSHVYYYPNGTGGNCGYNMCQCYHWMCTNISSQNL